MKLFFYFTVYCFLSLSNIFGQDLNTELSCIEKFSSLTGVVIEKEYIELGNIDVVDVRFMKVRNLSAKDSLAALRLEYQFENQVITKTIIAYIDADEFKATKNAIRTIITILPSKKIDNSEVSFRTRSGVIFGCYYSPEQKKWATYIQLDFTNSKSTVFISKIELAHFINIIEDAEKLR